MQTHVCNDARREKFRKGFMRRLNTLSLSLSIFVSRIHSPYSKILYLTIGMQKHSRSPFNKGPSSNRARRIGVYSKIILHRIGAIYPVKNDGESVCKRAKRKRADVEKKIKKIIIRPACVGLQTASVFGVDCNATFSIRISGTPSPLKTAGNDKTIYLVPLASLASKTLGKCIENTRK